MRTVFVSLILLFSLSTTLPAAEITFTEVITEEEWKNALRQAKNQNLMIFVDVYASWCGPCKAMDQDVYTDDAVGDFFNTTFLNIKMDGETTFGETFMVNYEIDAYPTFLFFNAAGEVINTASGYMEPAAFVELGKETLNTIDQRAEWALKYQAGNLSVDELMAYSDFLFRLREKEKARAVVLEYLAAQQTEDLLPFKPWTLLKTYALNIDNPLLQKVLEEEESFIYWRGADEVRQYYDDVLQYNLNEAATGEAGPDIMRLERALEVLLPFLYEEGEEEEALARALSTRQSFYLIAEDADHYIQVTDAYIEEHAAEDSDFLLNTAQQVLMMENEALYPAAEGWAKRAWEMTESFDAGMYYAYALSLNNQSEAAMEFLKVLEERYKEDLEYLQAIEDLKQFVRENRED